MGYLWGFWFVLTTLTVLVLKFFDPEKSRPSIDDGASAPDHMSVQQRVMNAVSLKNMAQRELHAPLLALLGRALPDPAVQLPCRPILVLPCLSLPSFALPCCVVMFCGTVVQHSEL